MDYTKLIRTTDEFPLYDGALIHQRFAYKLLRDEVSPIGNIIAFRAPMKVEGAGMIDLEDVLENDYIYSKDAINFCWEIPHLDPFGAVAFQRLFNTQIASVLFRVIQAPIEVSGDDIFIIESFTDDEGSKHERGKCSVSITYSKDNAALGHTGINVNVGSKAPKFAYSTHMNDEQCNEFMKGVIDVFTKLVNSIFIATTKIIVA